MKIPIILATTLEIIIICFTFILPDGTIDCQCFPENEVPPPFSQPSPEPSLVKPTPWPETP